MPMWDTKKTSSKFVFLIYFYPHLDILMELARHVLGLKYRGTEAP